MAVRVQVPLRVRKGTNRFNSGSSLLFCASFLFSGVAGCMGAGSRVLVGTEVRFPVEVREGTKRFRVKPLWRMMFSPCLKPLSFSVLRIPKTTIGDLR